MIPWTTQVIGLWPTAPAAQISKIVKPLARVGMWTGNAAAAR